MTEEVKPDVIKKTQDSLKKHIKKPPLTEKLLKKPPFRFLHDIITSVIKETGFLNGLFSAEELNHENIKDRDGKIAFLDKLISAVKIITGIPLSVRATKIVAGHEPTKTNELLQAIGLALDKKLDSKDVAQQLRKKGSKKSEGTDSKKSSPRDVKAEKSDAGKSKSQEKSSKLTEESMDKKKHASSNSKNSKDVVGQEESGEKKKRSSSTSKQTKLKDPNKVSKSKKEGSPSENKAEASKEVQQENLMNNVEVPTLTTEEPIPSGALSSEAETKKTTRQSSALRQQKEEKSQLPQQSDQPQMSDKPVPEVPSTGPQESSKEGGGSNLSLPPLLSEQSANNIETKAQTSQPPNAPVRAPSAAPQTLAQSTAQAPAPVPLARPRTAARVGSARPGAPRVRNRGEAAVVTEDLIKPAPVNLIVEDDISKTSPEDEDENLVVVETVPVDGVQENHQPSAPAMSRPSSQQGHLVAQILETQKELEVGASVTDSSEAPQYHTEIEWEAGKRRERETAMKEVDRMRSLIQTLTRASHPLGKLLDSLQEDVDNMQRELYQWQNMQTNLEQQLLMEETLCSQASQPLKERLKQLQQSVRSQLDQICTAKANIFSNDERIRRLLTGLQN